LSNKIVGLSKTYCSVRTAARCAALQRAHVAEPPGDPEDRAAARRERSSSMRCGGMSQVPRNSLASRTMGEFDAQFRCVDLRRSGLASAVRDTVGAARVAARL